MQLCAHVRRTNNSYLTCEYVDYGVKIFFLQMRSNLPNQHSESKHLLLTKKRWDKGDVINTVICNVNFTAIVIAVVIFQEEWWLQKLTRYLMTND